MQYAKPPVTVKNHNLPPYGSPHTKAVFLNNFHIYAAHPVDPDITHLLQLSQKFPDGHRISLHFHLHASVPLILHPAGQAKTGSHPAGSGAKAYALDVSVKIKMFPYFLHAIFPIIKAPAASNGIFDPRGSRQIPMQA